MNNDIQITHFRCGATKYDPECHEFPAHMSAERLAKTDIHTVVSTGYKVLIWLWLLIWQWDNERLALFLKKKKSISPHFYKCTKTDTLYVELCN